MTAPREQRSKRLPNWLIGLVLIVVVSIASLLAYTKELPWGDAYEIRAVFSSAQSVRPSSPVRIAGVNVGEVTSVEHLTESPTEDLTAQAGGSGPQEPVADPQGEQGAIVTMELTEDALPIHEDATFKLRPRLFLEGNYFVDLEPGSPNAKEIVDGHTFPVNQTAYSVQLDTILTTLQGDVRTDLQVFLNQFGNALIKHGGAEGFRELYRSSPPSYKFTSQVNEAVLGTEPGDLGGLIKGLDRVVRGLGRNERTLQDLVTNLPHLLRLVRGRGRRARTGDRGASEHARRGSTRVRESQLIVPGAARIRSRGAAGHPLGTRDAARGDPVHRPGPGAGIRARAARPGRRPAADDPEPGEAREEEHQVPRADPQALELLQRGRDPVVA